MPAAWQVETYTREKKKKQKQKIEEHSLQSSQEETSVIDSNIGEENRIEEYTGTTNLKVQCNTSQVYDQWF